jgi:hypothetical protein
VDLPLDRVDVGDGCVVEVPPPDERLQLRLERAARRRSPATARALMKAARSQFCPTLS